MKKNKEAELDCSGTFIGLMSNKLTENYWNKINEHKNNMKTYRLIKWYPSLPKDWKVGMEIGQGDDVPRYYSPCSAVFKNYYAHKDEIENNPDFWQEVDDIITDADNSVNCSVDYGVFKTYDNDTPDFSICTMISFTDDAIRGEKGVFKTKEKALEFIEENQPKYSKKDMIDFVMYTRKNWFPENRSGVTTLLDGWLKYVKK